LLAALGNSEYIDLRDDGGIGIDGWHASFLVS
jgi:hypothetical protein